MKSMVRHFALLLALTAVSCGPNSENNGTNNGTNETNNETTGTNNGTTGTNNGTNNGAVTCATITCDDNASCQLVGLVPTCACDDGFEGDGTSCTDVDECAAGTDNCDDIATCENVDGGFMCACPEDYDDPNGDGTSCEPVDECAAALDDCDPNALCENTDTGFTCACPAGYVDTNGDGTLCEDIDECADGTDACSDNATCTNTPSSYECACNDPFVGDGFDCVVGEIVGALTDVDPGMYADGTYAESCMDYRYPAEPYLYQGSTGNGFYAIQPAGKPNPIVVECRQAATANDPAGPWGWTFITPATAQALGITMADLTGSGGCGFDGDSPSGHATGALGCRYDIDLGFTFDEIFHGGTAIRYDGISDGLADPALAWVNEQWGTPYCAGDFHSGDIQWGNTVDAAAAYSAGRTIYKLVFNGADPEPCASTFAASEFGFGPPSASTRALLDNPDTKLRLEFGMEGTTDRGWAWESGAILVRDTSKIPAP